MMASLEDVVAGAIPNVSDCFPKGSDNTQNKDKNNSLTKGSDNTQTKGSDRLLKAAPQSSPDQEDCPEIEIVFQQLPGNAKIMRRSPLTTFPMPCFLLEKKSPYAAHWAEARFDSLFKNMLRDAADFRFSEKVGKIFANLTKLRGKLRLRRS